MGVCSIGCYNHFIYQRKEKMTSTLLHIAIQLLTIPKCFSKQLYPTARANIGSCPRLTDDSDIFGNRTAFSNKGLLSTLFIRADETEPRTLRIVRARLLSEAIGLRRDTASSVSFLLEYEVPGDATLQLAQVALDCVQDQFNLLVDYSFFPAPDPNSHQTISLNTARNSVSYPLRSTGIEANFSTEPEFKCGECGNQGGIFTNTVTQCIRK